MRIVCGHITTANIQFFFILKKNPIPLFRATSRKEEARNRPVLGLGDYCYFGVSVNIAALAAAIDIVFDDSG